MKASGLAILQGLQTVDEERRRRADRSDLDAAVRAVKTFQHARFERSYADLLADTRHAGAARFFLRDLYGPADFTARDQQFARIVPALVKLFPDDIVQTVATLADLHALSEVLDSAMGSALLAAPGRDGRRTRSGGEGAESRPKIRRDPKSSDIDPVRYAEAWRRVGRPLDRRRQIELTLEIGSALDAYTRRALVGRSLRWMRGPARATGLSTLHAFLERGFETFNAMQGADHFLATIARREREFADRLFAGGTTEEAEVVALATER